MNGYEKLKTVVSSIDNTDNMANGFQASLTRISKLKKYAAIGKSIAKYGLTMLPLLLVLQGVAWPSTAQAQAFDDVMDPFRKAMGEKKENGSVSRECLLNVQGAVDKYLTSISASDTGKGLVSGALIVKASELK